MGLTILSLSAEIFFQHYEDLTIKHWLGTEAINYYTRHVNNIFIIFDSRKTYEINVLRKMNKIHQNIQFKSSKRETVSTF